MYRRRISGGSCGESLFDLDFWCYADVAQLVELQISILNVASSSLVVRSTFPSILPLFRETRDYFETAARFWGGLR